MVEPSGGRGQIRQIVAINYFLPPVSSFLIPIIFIQVIQHLPQRITEADLALRQFLRQDVEVSEGVEGGRSCCHRSKHE